MSLSSVVLGLAGCLPDNGESLTIATAWPPARRALFDDAIRRASTRVRWITLAPGDDVGQVVLRRVPPDLVLGGPGSEYATLDRQGLLEPSEEGGPAWNAALRSSFGLARKAVPRTQPRTLAFDDPRRDPVSLAWAKAVLGESESWAEGYARLVRLADTPRRPDRHPGAALSAVENGEAEQAPAVAPRDRADGPSPIVFTPVDDWPDWVEGVAIVRGSQHADRARSLLRQLAEQGLIGPAPATLPKVPVSDSLLADLLGASLVDARDELVEAWSTLESNGRPERSEMWMTQAPPWPPASVAKILQRPTSAMPMLETLAGQLAPDADVRAWLMRSWLAKGRLVDDRLLDELAGAVDGRLVREPRFRTWLRSEWTAWARQRYRRVARQARAGPGAPSS